MDYFHVSQAAIIAIAFITMMTPYVTRGGSMDFNLPLVSGLVFLALLESLAYEKYTKVAPVDAQLKALLAEYPNNVVRMGISVDLKSGTITCARTLNDESEASVVVAGVVAPSTTGHTGKVTAERTESGWDINNAYLQSGDVDLVTPAELATAVRKCATADYSQATPAGADRVSKAWAERK